MARHVFSLASHRAGMLLLLCLLAASSSQGIKLKSSGIHMLVMEKEPTKTPSLHRLRRDVSDSMDPASGSAEVRQFHMKSALYSRFATVTINSEVVNTADGEGQEVAFQVQVPEVAFMSNFTMVVDGQVHVAQVMEKQAAEDRYQEAKERNQTAAQVKQVPVQMERGMELFQIVINLAPHASATFTLVYNELLERRRGVYKQTLVVQPGAIVSDMSVSTSFAERQGFTYFAYTLPGNSDKMTSSSAVNQTEMTASVNSRQLIFRPTKEMQRQFDSVRGIHGEFTIYYSVNSESGGGSIMVQNEYFAHFFAPEDLDALPMNILFIIDISGSMSGEKIQQAAQAMLKILDDLKERASDTFNILLFDDKVETWSETLVTTLESNLERAKGFVQKKLVSRGGTNIHRALMEGLAFLLGEETARSCDTAHMIIFLTDGDPTSGITDTERIIREVTSKNNDRASIHSLGFGFNLNFDFLSRLSAKNRGLVRRIYAEGDAQDQLRDFYQEISTPVLCNVVASYSTDVVSPNVLTLHEFPIFFKGKEIIVAGKLKHVNMVTDSSLWDAKLRGTGANGRVDFVVPAGQVQVVAYPGIEEDLTEKLWAYMKIKSLLQQLQQLDDGKDPKGLHAQALNMSLTYGFVTPLTSFSIVVENVREKRKLESMASNPRSHDVYSMNSPGNAFPGKASMCRWSQATLGSLLIGLLLLQ